MRQAVSGSPTEGIDIERLRSHVIANYVAAGPSEGTHSLKMTASDLAAIAVTLEYSHDQVKSALVKKGFNFYGETCLPRPEGFEWLFPAKPVQKVRSQEEEPGPIHAKLDAGQARLAK